jgi:hypothetical protein
MPNRVRRRSKIQQSLPLSRRSRLAHFRPSRHRERVRLHQIALAEHERFHDTHKGSAFVA